MENEKIKNENETATHALTTAIEKHNQKKNYPLSKIPSHDNHLPFTIGLITVGLLLQTFL